jgi:hypothetical protein
MDEYVCVCMCGKKTRTDADARCFVLLVAGKMRRGKGDRSTTRSGPGLVVRVRMVREDSWEA